MKLKNRILPFIFAAMLIFSPSVIFTAFADYGGEPFTPDNINNIHGITYTHHPDGISNFTTETIAVLEIAPDADAMLLSGVPHYDYMQGYRDVAQMAQAYTEQGYDVIAAINGGFFGLNNPAGAQVLNQGVFIHHGELLRHWGPHNSNEYISQEHYVVGTLKNGEFFHGHNPLHTIQLSVNGGDTRTLQNLNSPRSAGNPGWRDLNLLTERFGEIVPSRADRLAGTDVRLEVISGKMAFGEELIMRVVQTAHPAVNNAPVGAGYAILTASNARDTAFLNSLKTDDIITVSHTIENRRGTEIDWLQVDQAVAAHFSLIKDGERQPLPGQPDALIPAYPGITPNPDTGNPLPLLPGQNTRRPRTAVGLRADGTMVWVVVSGDSSSGMTVREFQNYLMSLNLEYAWNFDGGGSSAMVIGETLVTYANGRDSDFQRSVANGFVLVSVPEGPFIDVKSGDWFNDYVMFAYENDLISAAGPMKFKPDMMLTRATLVTAFYNHAGSPDVSGLENPFSDITEGKWYADAVIWAAHNDIVQGIGGGRFAPDQNITREQLAAIMLRYANATNQSLTDIYQTDGSDEFDELEEFIFADDEDISEWATEAVRAIRQAGIMLGKPGNLFDPQGNATRAEAATILYRFIVSAQLL